MYWAKRFCVFPWWVALSCGYENVERAINYLTFENKLEELLKLGGPNFLSVKVYKGNQDKIKRIELSPEEITKRFMNAIK